MKRILKNIIQITLLLAPFFFISPALASTKVITNLVIFGDSLSDRGSSQYGGFNRYSNGEVWPEYLEKFICSTCLQDYAWGGAKTNYSNYNGFNWSGILWQIKKYQLNTNPENTLYIIWAGENDLIKGNADGAKIANNILLAVNQLVAIGAKNIAIFNLPDFTFSPAYNNPKLKEYKEFSPRKKIVKMQIITYNNTLKKLILDKKREYILKHQVINLYLIDLSNLFNDAAIHYKNNKDPWLGTYQYPYSNGYMWWDAWHPMSSLHQYIANYTTKSFKAHDIHFKDISCAE